MHYFVAAAIILVVFTFLFTNYFDHFTPNKEMKEVMEKRLPRMKKPEGGLFFMRFFPNVIMIILHLAFSAMFKIYVEWNDSFKKQQVAETEKKISELNFLKAQLNPHFFFNSLNTIFSLAIKKSDKTSVAVLNLSDLMRYMLYETNKEMVLLNEELLYIENYIELQKLRLTENNKIEYEVIGNPNGIKIPPLLFISFIENAFKHGISTATNSEIYIKFNISKKEIHFFIVNDINKQPKNDEASGLGMENTLKRIALYFPESHTLKTYVEDNKFYVDLNLKLNEN
ncbi:sensor histidine kinase [Flavobacterium arcticum]|uniref:sensor histidine kinase n=1 Tax=Flavobacterium arcticum TaxID=1784713 RepID=UPI0013C2FAD3|nr:sensor histidine kinase [Flavobacterium arcticum]KAF2513108.1 sensor histidine kinase [Flavobacterium arcticum]